ncbi:hypothetical protein ALC56_03753 [Trachymyrmex septentrionalis]|uniref:Uncharacterized protein n=1 Tax=Trachymyrmex septentrionalis TaxID=34720 RepID=A0A195FMY2_9HYME|nr:hypothetical protein ALC56_03753 [Trachymyrmex septentrionalis]
MVTSWMHACSFVCYTRRVNEVTAVQLPSRWRRDQSSYGTGFKSTFIDRDCDIRVESMGFNICEKQNEISLSSS